MEKKKFPAFIVDTLSYHFDVLMFWSTSNLEWSHPLWQAHKLPERSLQYSEPLRTGMKFNMGKYCWPTLVQFFHLLPSIPSYFPCFFDGQMEGWWINDSWRLTMSLGMCYSSLQPLKARRTKNRRRSNKSYDNFLLFSQCLQTASIIFACFTIIIFIIKCSMINCWKCVSTLWAAPCRYAVVCPRDGYDVE